MRKTSHLRLAASARPAIAKGTVTSRPPTRRRNTDTRTREHLTPDEVEALIAAAKDRGGRYAHRDATLVLITYRHGLRVSEAAGLRWDQLDFTAGVLHVTRAKRGLPSTHPVRARELRALRKLQREQQPASPYVFTTERQGPMSPAGIRKLVARIGQAAKFPTPVHPHQLRHGCGFALASAGHDTRAIQGYLGHKTIQHTVRYTELAPGRFKDFWRD